MPNTNFTWRRIARGTIFTTIASGVGPAMSAAVCGNPVVESAAVGLGAGLFVAGTGIGHRWGLFGEPNLQPQLRPLTCMQQILYPAGLALMGLLHTYVGIKLLLNIAISIRPVTEDFVRGLPITILALTFARYLISHRDAPQATNNCRR